MMGASEHDEKVHADEPCRSGSEITLQSGVAGSGTVLVENPLLSCVSAVLTEKATRAKLKRRGVPELQHPELASIEQKICGLANISMAYWPTTSAVRFAQRVLAQVHVSLSLRNPEDARYVQFIYEQGSVLRGARVGSAPDFLASTTGAGFILAGPSGSGKTAFLQRLRVLIGTEPSLIQTSRGQFSFVPMLILRWPDCGKLTGLLSNLREALIGELGLAHAHAGIFSNLVGTNGPNAAIATCIILNLGLLVIDGMCLRSIRAEYLEILDFISTFEERTGIPTVLSCTYPALQVLVRSGSKQANLGGAGQEYWDLEPPGRRWNEICSSFWKLGYQDRSIPVPAYLPELLWESSRGNMRILAQGYAAIHQAVAYQPALAERATRAEIIDVLEVKLRQFREHLAAMAQVQQRNGDVDPEDIWTYADYLPYELFSQLRSLDFQRKLRINRR
jgi:hypothetical protein